MGLDPILQRKLDAPTKDFEVAFRCYVSDVLLSNYSNESDLQKEVLRRVEKAEEANTILTGKISGAKKNIIAKWDSFYANICFARDCFNTEKHIDSHDVTYVSDTILITYIFQDLFRPIIGGFEKPENYAFYAGAYHSVRNFLSHPGSTLIEKKDAENSLTFIQKCCELIDAKYFWYVSVSMIQDEIKQFEVELHKSEPIIENLDLMPFPTHRIVCREKELEELFKYVCGWANGVRCRNRKHSVCVYGYGGIGKTALITEFISRLLCQMATDEYHGLRPNFILFFSAKKEMIEVREETDSIYSKRMRSHFESFDALKKLMFKALSVEEFSDDWSKDGILIIDNLETLSKEERTKIINYIFEVIPDSVHVILTTRILEEDGEIDYPMPIKGFQNEEGVHFIDEYILKNNVGITMKNGEKRDLVKHSYGNSLVLSLALKRLAKGKSSFTAILNEMKLLPHNNTISEFMYQNTVTEIIRSHPEKETIIKSVLKCLTLDSNPLSAGILAYAHRDAKASIDDIQDVLQLLTDYLIVEKANDCYIINEFAKNYILVSLASSDEESTRWRSRLTGARNDAKRRNLTVDEFKEKYPALSEILKEWCGESSTDDLAVCHAFDLYGEKHEIGSRNTDYVIETLRLQFDEIKTKYPDHPYVYYQWARILKELRQEGIIKEQFNSEIIDNYERCIMLIDNPNFQHIKETKTYPSIHWIFSIYLFTIHEYEKSSSHAEYASKLFQELDIRNPDADDALAIYALAEVNLFAKDKRKANHLKNARKTRKKLPKGHIGNGNLREHVETLDKKLREFNRFK